MRLLINCLSSISGGAETYLRNLLPKLVGEARLLDKSVELILLCYAAQRDVLPSELKVRRLELSGRRSVGLGRVMREAIALRRVIRAEHVEIVFTPYQAAPMPQGPRHVMMLRNMEPFRFRRYTYGIRGAIRNALLEKWSARCLRRADRVIAVSDFAYACAERELHLDSQRLRMVYHGRDPAFDALPRVPGQVSKETSPSPFPYILSVGSLLPYRRAEDIIEAFSAHVSPLIPNLHLVFAGDSNEGAYKAYLRQKVRESADPDKIRFLGNVPPQSLPALYRGASCYVASTEIEACPNSVIEALASSCPIVASKAHPLPEILSDSAIFYEPRNLSELGSAIAKVVTDSKVSESFSHSSWERARHFSWDACAKSTAKALLDW